MCSVLYSEITRRRTCKDFWHRKDSAGDPDFDPVSKEHLKRSVASEQVVLPVDYYIRCIAAVVANSGLEVATKCQAQLPAGQGKPLT